MPKQIIKRYTPVIFALRMVPNQRRELIPQLQMRDLAERDTYEAAADALIEALKAEAEGSRGKVETTYVVKEQKEDSTNEK
jgi:uncharacterized protein with FMN-binding domain